MHLPEEGFWSEKLPNYGSFFILNLCYLRCFTC